MIYDIYGNAISSQNGEDVSILSGKKWIPFGDSITLTCGYRGVVCANYGLTEISGGYAGSRCASYASGSGNCVLEHLDSIAEGSPDIVTIALGTNDYGNGAPIGEVTDDPAAQNADSYTFLGCMKRLIVWLHETYGDVTIVLFTPFRRNTSGANKNGDTLADFADAVKALGQYYSILVCDLYAESGLSIGTLTDKDAESWQYTWDGLHLLPSAMPIVVPKIKEVMERAISTAHVSCASLSRSNGGSYTLASADAQRIYVVMGPGYTTDRVEWASSNENVVKVKAEPNYIYANLTAVSNGMATVTAKCGNVMATFDVTVSLT